MDWIKFPINREIHKSLTVINVLPIGCVDGVTVHEVKLLTDSGKSDYAQVGEGVIFSCLYILDPGETILSIVWEKDKEQVTIY